MAKPFLDNLARETGETINFGILNGSEVYYLDKRDSQHPLRLSVEIGGRAPAYSTALGKAMLAFFSEEELNGRFDRLAPLKQFTQKTIRSWAELEADLAHVREDGIANDNEELYEGLRCMSAPVFKHKKVVAAISISIPVSRCEPTRMEVFKKLLVQQAGC
jgi:DNA-binding IclR family transcriptional regulator